MVCVTSPQLSPSAFLPPFLPQCLHDVPAVREAAAEALGTALKVVGEGRMAAYLDELESLKMSKVRPCDYPVTGVTGFKLLYTFLYIFQLEDNVLLIMLIYIYIHWCFSYANGLYILLCMSVDINHNADINACI